MAPISLLTEKVERGALYNYTQVCVRSADSCGAKCSPHAGGLKEWSLGKGGLWVWLSQGFWGMKCSVTKLICLCQILFWTQISGDMCSFSKPDHRFFLLSQFRICRQQANIANWCKTHDVQYFFYLDFFLLFILLHYRVQSRQWQGWCANYFDLD